LNNKSSLYTLSNALANSHKTPDTYIFLFHVLSIEVINYRKHYPLIFHSETHTVEESIYDKPGNADLSFEI
jgi:hypothetical protein